MAKIDQIKLKIMNFIESKMYRLKYGFYAQELWSLDYTIMKFTLPRLKKFREDIGSYPMIMHCVDMDNPTEEEMMKDYTVEEAKEACDRWRSIVDQMIWSMEENIKHDGFYWNSDTGEIDSDKEKKVKEGMDLFHKYFHSLWN